MLFESSWHYLSKKMYKHVCFEGRYFFTVFATESRPSSGYGTEVHLVFRQAWAFWMSFNPAGGFAKVF